MHPSVLPVHAWKHAASARRLHRCCRYELPAAAVRAQVAAALATVGLAAVAQRPTHTLSGGQRQRCAIAGALTQAPKARTPVISPKLQPMALPKTHTPCYNCTQ